MGRPLPRTGLVRCRGGGCIPCNSNRWLRLGIQKRRARVGLRTAAQSPALLFFFSLAAVGHAAPVLRLVGAAIGPVPANQGSVAATQTVEAYNIGDGSLSLRATSSVP